MHWLSAEQEPWHAVPLHGVLAPQGTGVCDEHVPLLHVAGGIACAFGMVPEQLGATPQLVPFVTGAWHTPARHVSSVHELPSLPHDVPSATLECTQPDPGLHESLVHGLPSSHETALPAPAPVPQLPDAHFSPVVQALPSSQELPESGCATHPEGS